MRKFFAVFTLTLLLVPYPPALAAYSAASATNYLSSHNTSPWTVMGLAALGENSNADHLKNISGSAAIDYEAPILAISSIGQDPRSFGATDYVAKLESFHNDGQIGDATLLNDDIFGILALISAGVSASNPMVANAKSFILTHQDSSGGWGYGVSAQPDTNTTAATILALLSAGTAASDNHIQNAVAYLQAAQNTDGGFPYDPKSSFGTTSDTSSTAWVMWAENALSTNWSKNGHKATDFLANTQTGAGYFEYQSGSGEDSFTPVTTAYAVIALTGKSLPLKTLQSAAATFDFRIEGASEQACSGKTAGPTALDIIKNAASQCGFTYHITDTSFGPYLDQINNDKAAGNTGWIYLINFNPPSVGAADYQLKKDDAVLWFYGDFNWSPMRLSLSAADIAAGSPVTVAAESWTNNAWQPLADATVHFGTQTALTNAGGQAVISPTDGYYQVFAQKDGFVRSNSVLLKVGAPPSAAVQLKVTVDTGEVLGENENPPADTIAFTVEPGAIDFGTLLPGKAAEKQITITNTGVAAIQVESAVTGDDIFRENLQVTGKTWRQFETDLGAGASQAQILKLTVPVGYTKTGEKSGQVTFWAQTQ